MFLTSGLYWTHLLCWIPFRVAPFSLDAPAVWGGRLGALVRARLLYGGLGSCFHWARLLRREPLRVFLPGRACCVGTRSESLSSPRARLMHGSASCDCCAASAVMGLPMTPCGVSHALFGLVFAYVFSEIALSCCVFAASAVVRGLGSCFLSLRLFACLCCRLSFGGVAMFHVKHFEACEKRTENVSRETFVCRNMSSEGASSAASLVALVRCRERSVLRVSRGPCLVRDAPGCPGMGVKRAAWTRTVEGGVADRRARRTRRTRRAQGVPLCAARSVRRPEVWRGRVAMLGGVALRGGSVDRGGALRGQRRLGASLGGRRFAEDGLARGAALRGRRRSGCRRATGCRRGRRAGMGLSRRVRVSRRVSHDSASGGHRVWNRRLGVRMIRRPCLPGEGTARSGVRCEGIAHGPAAGPIASGSVPLGGVSLAGSTSGDVACGCSVGSVSVRWPRRDLRPCIAWSVAFSAGCRAETPSLVGCASGTGLADAVLPQWRGFGASEQGRGAPLASR